MNYHNKLLRFVPFLMIVIGLLLPLIFFSTTPQPFMGTVAAVLALIHLFLVQAWQKIDELEIRIRQLEGRVLMRRETEQ